MAPHAASIVTPDTTFACRARMEVSPGAQGTCSRNLLVVEAVGTIGPCTVQGPARLEVLVVDVTDGQSLPVLTPAQPEAEPRPYVYRTHLEGLSAQPTVLADWTAAARLDTSSFVLPRKGRRSLCISLSIESGQGQPPLASARALLDYISDQPGYLDRSETAADVRLLAIPLGLAVATCHGDLPSGAMGLIRGWALTGIDFGRTDNAARCEFEKALRAMAELFLDGDGVDLEGICTDLANRADPAQRIDILDFCLQVARGGGSLSDQSLALLRDLAGHLRIEQERFQAMLDKTIPTEAIRTQDPFALLGITADLPRPEALRQLNREYAKWNARVTNPDPEIRAQADQRLKLIADARNRLSQ